MTPIQMPHVDIDELKQGRKAFTKDEWLDILLRSIGMEPDEFTYREKWLLLTRMIPLVENNFNLCELGPRSTGKSHLYKEISPNSILISGGQTTVATSFIIWGAERWAGRFVGLRAFDEVAGIKFKDKDGIQIMKGLHASGSFARGKEEKAATASMVFVVEHQSECGCAVENIQSVCTVPTRKWERIQHSLTVYTAIFQAGRFRSSDRAFTDDYGLSVIIWQSLSENFVKNSMAMHLITISVGKEFESA